MRLQILEHFLNRPVEITLKTRKSFTGILRVSELDNGAVELEPTGKYEAAKYGAVIVMADDIITIRPMKPIAVDDFCEKDCYEDCADSETEPVDYDDMKKETI